MYRKLLVALLAAVISAGTAALTDNHLSPPEIVNIGIAIAGAASIWAAANVPRLMWAKALIAIVAAALTYLNTAVANCDSLLGSCLQGGDWIQVGVAAASALLVYLVPNTESGL